MLIEVTGTPATDVDRLRAFAEYRVFLQLAAVAPQVGTVRVVVIGATNEGPTSCRISAELKHGGRIRARSCGRQPVRVVDAAAEKLAQSARERLRKLW